VIRQVYRLTGVRQIDVHLVETEQTQTVLVRPEYLAICAADQRYYNGARPDEVLRRKLPMALIHEAVGTVYSDPAGLLPTGSAVVMVPNIPADLASRVRENYQSGAKFRSSGVDGFMQSLVPIERGRLVAVATRSLRAAVLCEPLSVAVNAVRTFSERAGLVGGEVLGIWGDGSVGFAVALALRAFFPGHRIVVFGHSEMKLRYFSFVETTLETAGLAVDHAFECVGGAAAGDVLDGIVRALAPQGTLSLLGVSEYKVPLDTRAVLEKGLSIFGHSRSSYEDFAAAVRLIEADQRVAERLTSIISEEIAVRATSDIHHAFERDRNNEFKTVLKWEV
jgi:ribitol-5-phosphate 2-dehydrogenase